MFAPSGLGIKSAENDPFGSMTVAPFGQGYLVIHSRQRITRDGGHSLLAVRDEAAHTRIGRVAAPNPTKGATTTGPSSATKKAPPFTVSFRALIFNDSVRSTRFFRGNLSVVDLM